MRPIHEFEPLWGEWYTHELLGQGSYGSVYSASRTLAGNTEHAAIKHISIPRDQSDLNSIYVELGSRDESQVRSRLESMRDRLISEYLQMKRFKGLTNIVSCEDIMCLDKQDMPGFDIFIRMELLECASNRILDGKMDRAQTVKMGIDICNALTLLRNENIVHRDVKPQNIFVNKNGDYKLGDFGTARDLQGTSAAMSMRGTFAYMSPEAMKGEKIGYESDLYSLGLVMYRLLNGNKSPFLLPGQASTVSQEDAANVRRMTGEELPPPSQADQELGKIILKALAYDRRDRWQSADDMRAALEGLYYGTVYRTTGTDQDMEKAKAEALAMVEREQKQKQQEQQKQQQQEQKTKQQKTLKLVIILAACVVVLVSGALGATALVRQHHYKMAAALFDAGDLPGAKAAFEELGHYKDASARARAIDEELVRQKTYQDAAALEKSGDYDGALALYQTIADHADAKTHITALTECIRQYESAALSERMKDYTAAQSAYEKAGLYQNAPAKVEEMKNRLLFIEAENHLENRQYDKAENLFALLSERSFPDAENRLAYTRSLMDKEAEYRRALSLSEEGRYLEAIALFETLDGYYDSAVRIKAAHYAMGEYHFTHQEYLPAISAFELAGDYEDAPQRLIDSQNALTEQTNQEQYAFALALEEKGDYENAVRSYQELDTYRDARQRAEALNACIKQYQQAQLYERMKDYEAAQSAYEQAALYLDAPEKATLMRHHLLFAEAEGYIAARDYEKAQNLLTLLLENGYEAAEERLAYTAACIEKEAAYQSALGLMKAGHFTQAIAAFEKLEDYADSAQKVLACYYGLGQSLFAKKDYEGAADAFSLAGEYDDAAARAKEARLAFDEVTNRAAYDQAALLEENGQYDEALLAYEALGKYLDAESRAKSIADRINQYENAQLLEKNGAYESALAGYAAAGSYLDAPAKVTLMQQHIQFLTAEEALLSRDYTQAASLFEALAQAGFEGADKRLQETRALIEKENAYQAALQLMKDKKWQDAMAAFEALNGYSDSKRMILACWYSTGCELFDAKDYAAAITAFDKAGDYEGARDRKKAAEEAVQLLDQQQKYAAAQALEEAGEYLSAIEAYRNLGDFVDAAARASALNQRILNYEAGQLRESLKDYDAARSYYEASGNYKDAVQKSRQMESRLLYDEAVGHMKNGHLEQAATLFKHLADENFLDAADQLQAVQAALNLEKDYDQAVALQKKEKWDEAIAAFEKLGDHQDARERLKTCWYRKAEALLQQNKTKNAAAAFLKAGDYQDARQRCAEMYHNMGALAGDYLPLWVPFGTKLSDVLASTYGEIGQRNQDYQLSTGVAQAAADGKASAETHTLYFPVRLSDYDFIISYAFAGKGLYAVSVLPDWNAKETLAADELYDLYTRFLSDVTPIAGQGQTTFLWAEAAEEQNAEYAERMLEEGALLGLFTQMHQNKLWAQVRIENNLVSLHCESTDRLPVQ